MLAAPNLRRFRISCRIQHNGHPREEFTRGHFLISPLAFSPCLPTALPSFEDFPCSIPDTGWVCSRMLPPPQSECSGWTWLKTWNTMRQMHSQGSVLTKSEFTFHIPCSILEDQDGCFVHLRLCTTSYRLNGCTSTCPFNAVVQKINQILKHQKAIHLKHISCYSWSYHKIYYNITSYDATCIYIYTIYNIRCRISSKLYIIWNLYNL